MRINGLHLAYCSNIHPANGWQEVFANLREHAPALKRRLSPNAPFGLGLRLSADESRQLLHDDHLPELQDFLHDQGLYVFTLNGFVHGDFHSGSIKEGVFAPDWRDPSRVQYTLRLIELLRRLLPRDAEGSISTVPLSYKAWVDAGDTAAWERMALNIIKICARLLEIKVGEDKRIHLDLEPEPDGLLSTADDVVHFFKQFLLPLGVPWLARRMGLTRGGAESRLLDLIRVCLDTCHCAVQFEDAGSVIRFLGDEGIKIGKLQVSAGLRVPLTATNGAQLARELTPFAEETYLHQTVLRSGHGAIMHFRDLADALPVISAGTEGELRSHFHVPLFAADLGPIGTTREQTAAALALLRTERFTRHVEIETYTWHVLPASMQLAVGDSIRREYEWVVNALQQTRRVAAGDA